jgi:uncharacterized membrane protein
MGDFMSMMEKVGVWGFYAGLIIAVIAAISSPAGLGPLAALFLGILGIIVGLLNVVDKEVRLFLVASIAFLVGAQALSAILATLPAVGTFIPTFLDAVIIFVAPGAAIVALRAIWDITRAK